jgi:[acyl-carrier-protein] S-malonyltransferase
MSGLEKAGARRVVPLAVSIAAHSPLMAPAASALEATIETMEVRDPLAPLIGNTSGRPLDNADAICQELNAQLTVGVKWTASMKNAIDAGVEAAAEIGPGSVLTGLMKRIHRKSKRVNVADAADVRKFCEQFD